MEKQKNGKNKIGARCLSPQEAELILPTYGQIKMQIELFRNGRETEGHNEDQKTNNIGIIGVRGAGKTSLLKTIRAELETENKNGKRADIILPIIVPENMSESSTLMATILGMLKDVVDKKSKEQKGENRCRYCVGEDDLKSSYNEVVKRYTFIQKEYRDILIQEYATENDYVRSSAKVFNSDVEFINKFNKLTDMLVDKEKRGLVFLFIDDIDLSTRRCTDVVKTLLSYLSNQNIVTFISGDLETFEEALTLDFIRQEEVLDKNVLTESMLANGKVTILDSKKRLAYEYLKKILPPIYRHNIKEWSLEEKGNYCIQSQDEEEKVKNRKLSYLLSEALEGWVSPAFFEYKDSDGDIEEKELSRKGALPYTYHLFDNTSRGLNNVYNVLNEIVEKRNSGQNDFMAEKKQLLDTIISSKQIFNQYRNEIQRNMFYVGTDRESSKVFFDNALAIIYKEQERGKDSADKNGGSIKKVGYSIEKPVERFSLFILVDFAARILYEEDYAKIVKEDGAYQNLKRMAMMDLFFHPEIAEKTKRIEESGDKWKEYIKKDISSVSSLYDVNINFLSKGELEFNLAYYKNLSLDWMEELINCSGNNERKRIKIALFSAELEQHIIIAFWKAVSSVARVNGIEEIQKEGEYYPVFWNEFSYMQSKMSRLTNQNLAIKLFDSECETALDKEEREKICNQMVPEKSRQEWLCMKRVLMNMIANYIEMWEKNEKKENEDIENENLLIRILEQSDNKYDREDLKKRIDIIKAVDKNGLWKEEAVEDVAGYLKSEVEKNLKAITEKLLDGNKCEVDWKIQSKGAVDSWKNFFKSFDGQSYTVAKDTKNAIKEIMKERNENKIEEGLPYWKYERIIQELRMLAWNSHVWYGRAEAQNLLNNLQESYAQPCTKIEEEHFLYFEIILKYYYRYKMAIGDGAMLKKEADLLAEITKGLSSAHEAADKQVLDTFINKLNQALSYNEEISIDEFEKLFG